MLRRKAKAGRPGRKAKFAGAMGKGIWPMRDWEVAVVWALFLRLAEPTSFMRYQRDRDCHRKHDQRPNHHVCGRAPAATLSHPFSPTIGLIGALVFPQAIPQSRPSAAGANVAGCKGAE
ncbi:hypothetical protein MPLDJ20_120385 [Mesorhizobium plurifarium]|uniref:Uncharacterized protein n=1 Tax=Mesorhizobium plurifarium TaxID=69974 RepID=A0A090EF34_MESPL|nr:hypothetical protein MPLDJ20_120385 [Mesorhizobium plurifarium]